LLTDTERQLILQAGLNSALVVPMIWHDQLVGMLSVASKQISGFTAWDAQFLTAVSSQVTAIVFMTTLVEELQVATTNLAKAHSDTVMMLASAAEAHDDTTGRHLQRVRLVTEALARELNYSEEQIHQLGLAAVLHDIGKVRVPDAILTSSEALSSDEWVTMKQHTFWGGDFLDGHHGFDLAAAVARCHHERWDGAGYPRGLIGDAIPEAAAITSVADSYDAMTNDRPYRAGRPSADAVSEIVSCSGKQFSPRVVDALVRLFHRGALPTGEADDRAALAA
jgi:HD-GYP domain-containing protein (c-di-GMP phosphodiesterase class II)